MKLVNIISKSKRAKERVKVHGKKMEILLFQEQIYFYLKG